MIALDRVENLLLVVERIVNGPPPARRPLKRAKRETRRKPKIVVGKVVR